MGDTTYRMNILTKLQQLYAAVQPDPDGGPVSADPWPFKFSGVHLGPLIDSDFRKNYSLGIIPGPEPKIAKYPFMEADWQVVLEFQAIYPQGAGVDQVQYAEKVLGVVQRVFYKNQTLDGTVIDVKELSNEIDLTSYGDKTVAGVVTIQVKYRHDHDDVKPTA